MASCVCCNVRPHPTISRRKRASTTKMSDSHFTLWPNHVNTTAAAGGKAKKSRPINGQVDWSTFGDQNKKEKLSIFNQQITTITDYEHFQHFFAATMAAAAAANVFYQQQNQLINCHQQQRSNEIYNYYQVLADMRVVKYFFDHEETIRLNYSRPVWRWMIVGEYVYFPSEEKWIFVNAYTNETSSDEDDDESMIYANTSAYLMPPPPPPQSSKKIEVPKVRYCAHRSHTPSSNFAEVVHREPIRENWSILFKKLSELKKYRTELNLRYVTIS